MNRYIHAPDWVRRLQGAHADHIESIYRAAKELPGNPEGIEILHIGGTKLYLSGRSRLENRAILTGNETLEELGEIDAVFERKGVARYFEINPANFFRTDPFSWKSEMLPALLSFGYEPSLLRCVWVLDEAPVETSRLPTLRRFTSADADEFFREHARVEPVEGKDAERENLLARQTFTRDWTHFIGYEGNRPVSVSKLFMNEETGYLAWGYTMDAFRRRGHHRAHALARVNETFSTGRALAFSVTDFNLPSSLSLQQIGFRLAYNYLLMVRHPSRPVVP